MLEDLSSTNDSNANDSSAYDSGTSDSGISDSNTSYSSTENMNSENLSTPVKKGLFAKLKEGLSKTRNNIVSGIDNIFSVFTTIDDDFYDELEETLIMGDLGVNATMAIIEDLKEKVKSNKIKDP